MGNFTRMIYLAAVMAAAATQGFAEEPVTPPFQEPQEEWVLTYDNYKGGANTLRDVAIVRDDGDLYIKGVFPDYPDSWIKGTVEDARLQLIGGQYLGMGEDGKDVMFYCGLYESNWSDGNTYVYDEKVFTPKRKCGVFAIAEDGGVMTPVETDASFWYTDAFGGRVIFCETRNLEYRPDGEHWVTGGTGFPDRDYMLKMRFQKKGESGVVGIGGDSVDDPAAPMYNLQGQEVDPATAGPGIYIRNGKKIVKTGR